jgi:predicted Zn-ribbon and HTH transcriptional regulator
MRIKIRDFRKAFLKAVDKRETQFKVGGKVFVTAFAKYLLEHLGNLGKLDKEYIEFDEPRRPKVCTECGYQRIDKDNSCPRCKNPMVEL